MSITLVTTQTLFREWRVITNAIIATLGDNTLLSTTEKASLVGAINELDGEIGVLSGLSTTSRDSIVNAINEVLTSIGDITSLTTTNKTDTVVAINEVVASIGILTSLTTTDKTSIVNAINELDTLAGDLSTLTTTTRGDAVYTTVINDGGAGYSGGDILTVIAGNSDATVTVISHASGVITAVSVTTGGTGYKNDIGVAVTGGTGFNALIDITVGTITNAVNEIDGNQGDLSTLTTTTKNTLVAAINELQSGSIGTNVLQVNNLEANKGRFSTNSPSNIDVVIPAAITAITVDVIGSAYTTPPIVNITGDGAGATATAILEVTGAVKSVILNAGGTGYTATDILTLAGGTGATITVSAVDGAGIITGFSLTAGGTGYTNDIGVAVAGGTGTGATFDTTIGFGIAAVTVNTGGSGYIVATVGFVGDGSGAGATATINSIGTFSLIGSVFQTHNSANLTEGGVFYDDNSNNGGVSASLAVPVSQLLTAMARSDLRYGHEFYLLDIAAGNGVLDGQLLAFNSQNYYPVSQNNKIFLSRAGNVVTWSGWVKAESINDAATFTGIVIGDVNTTTYIDGSTTAESVPRLLTPVDGWTHIRQTITMTKEYENIFPTIYANNLDNILVALSILLDGALDVGMHTGIV